MNQKKIIPAVFTHFSAVHSSFQPILQEALSHMDTNYLNELAEDSTWLPGSKAIFNAFSLPRHEVKAILFGESPYPRAASANGYAFWDAAVGSLWSDTGLSKPVNRATSLRNILKLLLIASGQLSKNNMTQAAIAALDKTGWVETLTELMLNFQKHGILLLNATLVFRRNQVKKDAKAWLPFMDTLLQHLANENSPPDLWLFGKIAEKIEALPHAKPYRRIKSEHPYQLSFAQNKGIIRLFQPLRLLEK